MSYEDKNRDIVLNINQLSKDKPFCKKDNMRHEQDSKGKNKTKTCGGQHCVLFVSYFDLRKSPLSQRYSLHYRLLYKILCLARQKDKSLNNSKK